MTAARPESIRFSAQASTVIGSAELRMPTTISGTAAARRLRASSRPPTTASATGRSVSVPSPSRKQISVAGASSRTPTLMKTKEAPQSAARASSMTEWRRLTLVETTARPRRFCRAAGGAEPSTGPTRLGHLTQVAPEQPLHRALGLTDGERDRIVELLEREPNDFELAVFSLLWSEHCGYKHSALLLKRLPSSGEHVLQGPGENAGVIDVGDGQAIAFKVESHNHPSAVEPFQGAATGVGGILRDIVAM